MPIMMTIFWNELSNGNIKKKHKKESKGTKGKELNSLGLLINYFICIDNKFPEKFFEISSSRGRSDYPENVSETFDRD